METPKIFVKTELVILLLTLNRFHSFFHMSIVDFDQVNAGQVKKQVLSWCYFQHLCKTTIISTQFWIVQNVGAKKRADL